MECALGLCLGTGCLNLRLCLDICYLGLGLCLEIVYLGLGLASNGLVNIPTHMATLPQNIYLFHHFLTK